MDIHLEMPAKEGAYWYYNSDTEAFVICTVTMYRGSKVIRFTDSTFQPWVGQYSYLVGPIAKPDVDDTGRVSIACGKTNQCRIAATQRRARG